AASAPPVPTAPPSAGSTRAGDGDGGEGGTGSGLPMDAEVVVGAGLAAAAAGLLLAGRRDVARRTGPTAPTTSGGHGRLAAGTDTARTEKLEGIGVGRRPPRRLSETG